MRTPDVEYAVREWLRAVPGLVGADVYFGVPDAVPDRFITMDQVGGSPTDGTAPLTTARLSLKAWGLSKKQASETARALVDLFTNVEEEPIGNGTTIKGATVDLILWQPAPDTGRARYIVDVSVYALPTTKE